MAATKNGEITLVSTPMFWGVRNSIKALTIFYDFYLTHSLKYLSLKYREITMFDNHSGTDMMHCPVWGIYSLIITLTFWQCIFIKCQISLTIWLFIISVVIITWQPTIFQSCARRHKWTTESQRLNFSMNSCQTMTISCWGCPWSRFISYFPYTGLIVDMSDVCWSAFRHGGNWPRWTFRLRSIPSVPPHFALSISKRATLTLMYMPLPYIAVVNSSNLSFNSAGTSHVSPNLDNASWNPLFISSN